LPFCSAQAYDCVNVDSVHNDGERHIPYITIFPESTKNKLLAWGKVQLANGMVPEQLACGCTGAIDPGLDKGCGRTMSDVTSMYIVYVLELYRWQNDTETLTKLWPIIKKAAQWQMSVSAEDGAPQHLENTYDILGPPRFKHVSYNTVFHLLAMAAAAELAQAMGEAPFAETCAAALRRGQAALDAQQWVRDNSTFKEMPNTYCPKNYAYIGSGLTLAECKGNCTGTCPGIFVSTDEAKPYCYTCSAPTTAPSSDYTAYMKDSPGQSSAHWSFNDADADSLMADSLYGQVWALALPRARA